MQNLARLIATHHVDFAVDDALADRTGEPIPGHARIVVWTFKDTKPLIVAAWSCLPSSTLDDEEAISLAKDLCSEKPFKLTGKSLVGEVHVL